MNPPPRLEVGQYAIEKMENTSRKNEEAEPKRNDTQLWLYLVMKAKLNAVKEQHCIGSRNVRSMWSNRR